jgi:hypothetical protein
MEIDTSLWVPVKMTVQAPGQPSIDMGLKFTAWRGSQVMTEMRMVIPNGFMVMEFSDYRMAKNLRRSHFKLL